MAFDGDGLPKLAGRWRERILRRDVSQVALLAYEQALAAAGVARDRVSYVASTGDGEELTIKDGHFYGMTTHARGATWLDSRCRAAVDAGALHARVFVVDDQSRVLRSRMTSQCAAGTGQFLENIARYLGIRAEEIGPLSLAASRVEPCSGICAVLSETDVINMVSRGIAAGEILRGVHDSIALRLGKLLRAVAAEGTVVLTGGLAADTGLKGALERALGADGGAPLTVVSHPASVYAGAIGAALWGEYRLSRRRQDERAAAAALDRAPQ
ncbi:MAG: benzoyl-CoA reductase subunit D [Archangiaceae bacterium]|nr:benzoyl-CoA reductase subunit D [Archangiaceae bacterium]